MSRRLKASELSRGNSNAWTEVGRVNRLADFRLRGVLGLAHASPARQAVRACASLTMVGPFAPTAG